MKILDKAREDLGRYKCPEPEETIKGKFLNILHAAMLAFPESAAVKIEASGSQSNAPEGGINNSLSIKIDPIYGFVE